MTADIIFLRFIFYFIIYSIAGWIIESIYRSFCEKKIIDSGFMNGPYCPIYGCGAIIMILLLQNFKSNIIILFCVSFVVLTVWEYIVGVGLEKIFHTKYWDYSDQKININGRVCLKNSIYWGILGVIFITIIHPLMEKMTINIQTKNLIYIDISASIIMIIDFIISSIKIKSISKKLQELKVLSDSIIDKIKIETQNKLDNKKNLLGETLEELQLKHNKLQMDLYKQLTRLKNAFPTMQWEGVNKFLSEKIEIKELKTKIQLLKEKIKNKSKEEE